MGVKEVCSGDQIKNNEVGGVCGKYGKQQSCIQDFGLKT